MKRLLILLMLSMLVSGLRAQAIEFNRRIDLIEEDYSDNIICNKGCVGQFSMGFNQITIGISTYLSVSIYSISSTGDTTFRYWFNPFENTSYNIIYNDDSVSIIRMLEITSGPNQSPVVFGNINLLKIHHRTGKIDWQRSVPGLGASKDNYYGFQPLGSFATSQNTIQYVSTRGLYPTTATAPHPFIQEYDTSGFLLRETDFLQPGNNPTGRGKACKLPGGDIFISQSERINFTERPFALWIDGGTHSIYKRKYLPFQFNHASNNDFKIEVIKPGNKFLVYAKVRRLGSFLNETDTYCYLTDSSFSVQNATWTKPNEVIKFAQALDDGHIMVIKEDGNTIFLEKWDALNGAVLFSTPILWQGRASTIGFVKSFDIDDTGNVYLTGATFINSINHYDIWLTKVRNMGIKWDAWAVNNPQGLANESKPLSLHAYPNPTSSRFKLRGYKEEEGLTLRLFNNSGKEVWRGVPSAEGEVDISNLSPGLYHVEALTGSGKRWSTRVVRE